MAINAIVNYISTMDARTQSPLKSRGDALLRTRKALKLSQEELGQKINFTRNHVNRAENAKLKEASLLKVEERVSRLVENTKSAPDYFSVPLKCYRPLIGEVVSGTFPTDCPYPNSFAYVVTDGGLEPEVQAGSIAVVFKGDTYQDNQIYALKLCCNGVVFRYVSRENAVEPIWLLRGAKGNGLEQIRYKEKDFEWVARVYSVTRRFIQ